MATSLLNPYLGAVWALLIIAVSWLIAGWSLRLTVFGTVFAWDLAMADSLLTGKLSAAVHALVQQSQTAR